MVVSEKSKNSGNKCEGIRGRGDKSKYISREKSNPKHFCCSQM